MDRTAAVQEIFEKYRPSLRERACVLCGSQTLRPMGTLEKYGFPARASMCRQCGLIFFNPMWSAEGYARFYEMDYRVLTGSRHEEGDRLTKQRLLGEWLLQNGFQELASLGPDSRVLEIGCDEGGLLLCLKERFNCRLFGVEPNAEAARRAGERGVGLLHASFDGSQLESDFFDAVLMANTLNHLVEPVKVVQGIFRILKPDGCLYLDVPDVVQASTWQTIFAQIDHPFMYAEGTARAVLESAGFQIARSWRVRAPFGIDVRFIARKPAVGAQAPAASVPRQGDAVRWRLLINSLKTRVLQTAAAGLRSLALPCAHRLEHHCWASAP